MRNPEGMANLRQSVTLHRGGCANITLMALTAAIGAFRMEIHGANCR
jgi:hypothetical protein